MIKEEYKNKYKNLSDKMFRHPGCDDLAVEKENESGIDNI